VKKAFYIMKSAVCGVGGVAQVVECQPRKCEALSSNPSTTKLNELNKVKSAVQIFTHSR
jgi:hypothetical protein